jgi:hypothetical protein
MKDTTKDRMICFRADEQLREALAKLAVDQRRTISSVITNLLADALRLKSQQVTDERRIHRRKQITAPALITDTEGSVVPGLVHDVSLSGIRLSTSSPLHCQAGDSVLIMIVFTLPDTATAISAKCLPKHIVSGDETTIGCAFVDPDVKSLRVLKEYLYEGIILP